MKEGKRTAVITGGGQGIGKAIAQRFLKDGLAVIIAESDREAGEETEKELSELGQICFIHTDVSKEEPVIQMVEKAVGLFNRIDVLVNNAALLNNKPINQLSYSEWNEVLAVNLGSVFICAKYASPYLKKSKGVIINIASTRAFMSEADTEAYSASKGGVISLTHALAVSLGPDIRVNSISPGWIDVTGWRKKSNNRPAVLSEADHLQHPAGRAGKPEDIASLAAYLMSQENSFITGANFTVDGGMTKKMIYV
jgi:NAD(P)-dependent dehydrogenase (short-subunit alcohol dehydrogenase family)